MESIKARLNDGRVMSPTSSRTATETGRRGHPLLRVEQGPDALRHLPEARHAGRVRRRGERLQADSREPVQAVGMASKAGANVAAECCIDNKTSSIGGQAAPQPPDPKIWPAPSALERVDGHLQENADRPPRACFRPSCARHDQPGHAELGVPFRSQPCTLRAFCSATVVSQANSSRPGAL